MYAREEGVCFLVDSVGIAWSWWESAALSVHVQQASKLAITRNPADLVLLMYGIQYRLVQAYHPKFRQP